MRSLLLLSIVWWGVLETVTAASFKRAPQFGQAQNVATVSDGHIREASGICASRTHKDVLYVHNDSGDTNRIYAISATSGQTLATITIDGAHAKDWEDIACGPCAGGSGNCIYIGDIGGNTGGDANTIYRIREPAEIRTQHVPLDSTLLFSWDQHNCESLMVDPHGEVYVISKVAPGHHGKLVHLPSNFWGDHSHLAVNSGVLLSIIDSGAASPVAADISPDGKEVLVKTYGHVYYYSVPDGDYYRHMTGSPASLPYHSERQGEAICWDKSGGGYYTLSEGSNQVLYYYRRTSPLPVG